MTLYTVINNETGQRKDFETMNQAIAFQEKMLFQYGIDCGVL